MEKYRSSGVVTRELLAGEVCGKTAVIIDDLISTGGTLVRAAGACRTAGARRLTILDASDTIARAISACHGAS